MGDEQQAHCGLSSQSLTPSTRTTTYKVIRLEAFTATKTNKVLPGFQPRQMVKSR
jgi:hypothetical protein